MTISPFIKTHLFERAYLLWEETDPLEPFDEAQRRIIQNLFLEIKEMNPWMSWLYSFIEFFNPFWMKRKVARALDAYKYDLFVSGKAEQKLHLFTEKEKWFITDQKISAVFKNTLSRRQFLTIKQRGLRWQEKVNKYWGKKEFMVAAYLLFLVSKKFPNIKRSIDWVKLLNSGLLETKSVESFKNLKDIALARGLTLFAGIPFDEKKGVFRIFVDLSYCVTKEEAKLLAETLWSSFKVKAHQAQAAVSKVFSKSA